MTRLVRSCCSCWPLDPPAVEREVLVVDVRGQRVGERPHDGERQVRAQAWRARSSATTSCSPASRRGFSTLTLSAAPAPSASQIARQVELRREHAASSARVVAVVRPVRVAPLLRPAGAAPRAASRTRAPSGQRRHSAADVPTWPSCARDVLDVRRPHVDGGRPLVEVRLAVGSPSAGLESHSRLRLGVVVIDGHAPAEQREDARAMQHRQQREHLLMAPRALDRAQQRRDRLQSRRPRSRPGRARRRTRRPAAGRARPPASAAARSSSSRSTTSLRRLTSSNDPHEPYPAGIGLASSQPPLAKR